MELYNSNTSFMHASFSQQVRHQAESVYHPKAEVIERGGFNRIEKSGGEGKDLSADQIPQTQMTCIPLHAGRPVSCGEPPHSELLAWHAGLVLTGIDIIANDYERFVNDLSIVMVRE